MACRKIGRILTLALLLLAAPARAEELAAMIAALDGRICSLDHIPESDRRLLATTREHRVQLYLRCQLKGRDEFVRTAVLRAPQHGRQAGGGPVPEQPDHGSARAGAQEGGSLLNASQVTAR